MGGLPLVTALVGLRCLPLHRLDVFGQVLCAVSLKTGHPDRTPADTAGDRRHEPDPPARVPGLQFFHLLIKGLEAHDCMIPRLP